MAKIDHTFRDLCSKIQLEGREYENKNRGVKRLQIPSYTLKHSFEDGFPAITNKGLFWKGITGELIWFLRGDNDIEYLKLNKIDIWDKDAYNWYAKHHSGLKEDSDEPFRMLTFEEFQFEGKWSVGKNYSVQWRDFQGVDQILRLVTDMKKDIMSSRLKVNAWNPAEIFETALPPCHSEFQVIGVPLTTDERFKIANLSEEEIAYVVDNDLVMEALEDVPEFGFELHWNQRSVDTFLGLPFNIASYGLLAKMLEMLTGYKALGIEGTLKCVHFYDNQYEAVNQLLERDPDTHANCELVISDYVKSLDPFKLELDEFLMSIAIPDFTLKGYTSDKRIPVKMLAPKSI